MYTYILFCFVQSVNTWMYIVGAEPPMPPKPVSAHTNPAYDPKTIRIKHLGYCALGLVYLRSSFTHHDKGTYHVVKLDWQGRGLRLHRPLPAQINASARRKCAALAASPARSNVAIRSAALCGGWRRRARIALMAASASI